MYPTDYSGTRFSVAAVLRPPEGSTEAVLSQPQCVCSYSVLAEQYCCCCCCTILAHSKRTLFIDQCFGCVFLELHASTPLQQYMCFEQSLFLTIFRTHERRNNCSQQREAIILRSFVYECEHGMQV